MFRVALILRVPQENAADRVVAIDAVQQLDNLLLVPYELALESWNFDVAFGHSRDQLVDLDRGWSDFRCRHGGYDNHPLANLQPKRVRSRRGLAIRRLRKLFWMCSGALVMETKLAPAGFLLHCQARVQARHNSFLDRSSPCPVNVRAAQ